MRGCQHWNETVGAKPRMGLAINSFCLQLLAFTFLKLFIHSAQHLVSTGYSFGKG